MLIESVNNLLFIEEHVVVAVVDGRLICVNGSKSHIVTELFSEPDTILIESRSMLLIGDVSGPSVRIQRPLLRIIIIINYKPHPS